MSGFEKYLEGNYDVGRTQEQVNKDVIRAKEIEAQIEDEKNRLRSQAINQVAKEKGISEVSSENEEELYNEYVNMEEEYLVDGAILQCNQATWDDFLVPGGEPVVLKGDFYKAQKPHTILCVSENPIFSNDLIFATVGDTIKDINIIPFKCNCKIEADRESEIEKIKNDESCSEHGVCRHLMQLNSEWENVSLEGSSYMSKRDISGSLQIDNYYLQQVRYGIVENPSIAVEKEGLNMCSILFCKHGGIITPVDSGQIITKLRMKKLEISMNQIAIVNTSLEPASALGGYTQKKIQNLCVLDGIVYFDENGYQRVKNTRLETDPYLVAMANYYRTSAMDEMMGDMQGYGAIFKVTFSSGKEIFVTMGDAKDPRNTEESKNLEGKDFYAGEGKTANTLEFICNYLNKNPISYSENMSGKKGSDVNNGKAKTITNGEEILSIDLLLNVEIEWETYFGEVDKE